MKSSFVLGSSIALFLGAAVAQYDEEVCDEQRFGEYSDPRVCESSPARPPAKAPP